jgi:hypothetical protein
MGALGELHSGNGQPEYQNGLISVNSNGPIITVHHWIDKLMITVELRVK